jgi:hypothetical protein
MRQELAMQEPVSSTEGVCLKPRHDQLRTTSLLMLALLVLLSGCASSTASPPRFEGRSTAAIEVSVRQLASFGIALSTNRGAELTLLSLSVIPLPGFRTPRLVHAALLDPVGKTGYPTSAPGWPPALPNRNSLSRFEGSKVLTTPLGAPVVILIGVSASRSSDTFEAIAGVRLSFGYQGGHYVANIWNAGVICLVQSRATMTAKEVGQCARANERVGRILERLSAER